MPTSSDPGGAATTTVIGAINPLTKVVAAVCLMVAGFVSPPWFSLVIVLVGVVTAALNRKLKGFLKLFAAGMLSMGLIIFVLNLVARAGQPEFWRWHFLAITQPGLDAAILYTSRFLVIGVGVMIIMHTTDLRRFSRYLEQRGVSSKATYVIQSTALILPQLVGRGAVIMDAQRARGIETDANLGVRLKALLPAAAPLILSTLTGMAERAVSLEARGMTLTGARTSLLSVRDTWGDKLARWLAIAALVAYLAWKVWLWAR
ncbi:MAG: energy-coupling factor transporter transmembrane protein EcfT [Propionibacteriaceae bacterium]|nr:energy-coupling factor transporter transmembrane protein EcfT [Propionibacteriaceae bacterium]